MDTWLKIGSAVLIGMMLLMLLPRAKAMLDNSPQAKPGDWQAAVIPLLLVAGLVALLMSLA